MYPQIRYTKSGQISIAYQVFGDGPVDLVCVYNYMSHIQVDWTEPGGFWPAWHRRLAEFSRLILFDPRGMGGSDRVATPSLEERMDDLRAVLDAVGSRRAALLGVGSGAWMPALFASTYPQRALALVLYCPLPRMTWAPDFPWGPTADDARQANDERVARLADTDWWLANVELADLMANVDWSANDDLARWLEWRNRVGTSPAALADFLRIQIDTDVRDVLPSIRVPTLIVRRSGDRLHPAEISDYVADRIPTAVRADVDGDGHFPWGDDITPLTNEIQGFLERAAREADSEAGEGERVLVTVLFTDIAGSTTLAAELGDARWRGLLDEHHTLIRSQLGRYRGRELDTAGDGFFASFDGPARAIRCACAIAAAVKPLGLEIRAGVHTGECEVSGGKFAGIAVHIGARVAALAGPGEVFASQTVRDLTAGSGLVFDDAGEHELKGVPDRWRLYRVRQ